MPVVRKLTPEEVRALPSVHIAEGMPQLTQADVRVWVGDTSVQRGRPYVQRSIVNPRRVGSTLKARVQGSDATPYRVEVALNTAGITSSNCSCPVGSGRCKHVAAVLLAYLEEPELFGEVEDVEASLERRSKPELIAIIRRMLAREPDLELLLELPTAGATGAPPPITEETVRRQVRAALGSRGRYDYDEYGGSLDENALNPLLQLGANYVSAGDWRSATIVFETVARELLERYEEFYDEDGTVGDVVNECVGGLGECLHAATEPAQRETILRALFHIYDWDIQYGGVGMGDEAENIIGAHATPDEKQMIARWVRAVLAQAGEGWSSSFKRQSYGSLLLALAGDQITDEEYIRIARETGRARDLVERLLALGRVDAALKELRGENEAQIIGFAELFVARGYGDQFERVVRDRLKQNPASVQLISWLKDRAKQRGDAAEALQFSETLFWQRPTLQGYQEISGITQTPEQWSERRTAMLNKLAKQNNFALLTEILLHDGEIDEAIRTLPRAISTSLTSYGTLPLALQVARAAEAEFPRDAISIYTQAAESAIASQGRENYRTATDHLKRVRDLYKQVGAQDEWRAYIGDLRVQQKRLRALQEELTNAGL